MAPAIAISLRRGSFDTYDFVPSDPPKAIILFGSGDGGWGAVENRVCAFMQRNGFYTVGIDFRKYAMTNYDSDTLVSDFAVMAADAGKRAGNAELPVIYGGWSMGAVQAVAACAGADRRSPRLVGLVLMSMDQRGRYGLGLPEQIGLEPVGEGTFGVAEFTAAVANLNVVQLSAIGDWMNNTDWIKTLKTSHRLYELENSNHDFNGADNALRQALLEGIKWILNFG
ncbi:MAG: AcvB/VirJ family lysyl-phosphatidylglycerol hydrolase [Chthoniobacterales bacterium]